MTSNRKNRKKIDKELMFGKIMPSYLTNSHADSYSLHNQSNEQHEENNTHDPMEKFKIREKILGTLNERQPSKKNDNDNDLNSLEHQIPQTTSEALWQTNDSMHTQQNISKPVWQNLDIPQNQTAPENIQQSLNLSQLQQMAQGNIPQAQNAPQFQQPLQGNILQAQNAPQFQQQAQGNIPQAHNAPQFQQQTQGNIPQAQNASQFQQQAQGNIPQAQNAPQFQQQAQGNILQTQNSVQFTPAFQQNVSEAPVQEEVPEYINIIEEALYSKLSDMIAKFKCCSCEHCRKSIMLSILNTVKPEYVYKKPSEVKELILSNNYTDISQPIVRAILDIKMNPPHKK